jgi:hypothetical protein
LFPFSKNVSVLGVDEPCEKIKNNQEQPVCQEDIALGRQVEYNNLTYCYYILFQNYLIWLDENIA